MKIVKILLIILSVLIVAIAGLLTYVKIGLPSIDVPENFELEATAERIERGEYLANNVMACMSCHSERDKSRFAQPFIEGTLGKGGKLFGKEAGLPGDYYASNITPANLDDWSDGELYRAIACGVSKDGRALFPIMPYPHYASADQEDIKAVIAYLRSIPPINNEVENSSSDFPMNFIINLIPQEANHQPRPNPSDRIAYGEYIYNIASCGSCHTPLNDEGQPDLTLMNSGGFEFPVPGGVCRSSNITPDEDTGIGSWSEEKFIERFKQYADSSYVAHKVKKGTFNTEMPWGWYSKMKEEDLSAVYNFLMDQEPIHNSVEVFAATEK